MCVDCGGLWIPGPSVLIAFPELVPAIDASPSAGVVADALCPECETGLCTFVIEDLALDACRACRGLWLDVHEILDLENARPAIARLGERVHGGGYRSQARAAADVTTRRCAGCDRPIAEGEGKPLEGGVYCKVCSDAIANPIEPPLGLAGRVRRTIRNLFRKPCPECGEYVCVHLREPTA
jgi:Zn-finger nucleic acid-binding protein